METVYQKFHRLHREDRNKSSRDYYSKNKDKVKAYRDRNKEKRAIYMKEWGKNHPDKRIRPEIKYKIRIYNQKMRQIAIESLGSKCVKCGFSDIRALQIDHINGGGNKERKERPFKMDFHKYVVQSFLRKENKYQLLCANCNWIKRSENCENRKE